MCTQCQVLLPIAEGRFNADVTRRLIRPGTQKSVLGSHGDLAYSCHY
jgi:hypothetical protein